MRSYLNKSEMIFFVNMMTNWQKTSLKIVLLRSQQQSHHLKMISNLIPSYSRTKFSIRHGIRDMELKSSQNMLNLRKLIYFIMLYNNSLKLGTLRLTGLAKRSTKIACYQILFYFNSF